MASTVDQFQENLPPVEIDANGVVNVRAQITAPAPEAAPQPVAPHLPQNLSSGMLSVLLQVQSS